ncbi:putative glycoside hydrolase [Guggenheimella bovis]
MRYTKYLLAVLLIVVVVVILQLSRAGAEPVRALHFVPSEMKLAVSPKDPFFIVEKGVELKDKNNVLIRPLAFQERVFLIASEGDRSLVLDRYGFTGYVPSNRLGDQFKSRITYPQKEAKYDEFYNKPTMFRNYYPVKGVYVPPRVIEKGIDSWLDQFKGSDINTLVIDYKDDSDYFLFDSKVAAKFSPEGNIKRIKNPAEWMQKLKNRGFYLIARVVVFKSPLYAKTYPERAILTKDGSPLLHDHVYWGSPYDETLWEYVSLAAKEALQYGFDEVQFDYVRFPDILDSKADYQGGPEIHKTATIQRFLMYARSQLRSFPKPISADVFGWTATAKDDVSIGQHWEAISNVTDVISPMIYPSHYNRGIFGLYSPNAKPYETVKYSLMDALSRNANLKNPALIRPWIQDFSMGYPYGNKEVKDQIRALEEQGIYEYLLWNASGKYHIEAVK